MEHTVYDQVTRTAADTIRQLTEESRGRLDEDNQSHWDMAHGVLRFWICLTGADARAEDVERLQLLIDDMPGVDNKGEGNWRASPVTHLS